jgi:ArsR family transcriptional regulator
MAINKSEIFDENYKKTALFAKALSHPARIMILKTLADKNACCGEIVEVMPLSQSTVSQHLKELKEIGIIQGNIEGPKSCYCIDWDNLEEEMEAMNKLMKEILDSKLTCCK